MTQAPLPGQRGPLGPACPQCGSRAIAGGKCSVCGYSLFVAPKRSPRPRRRKDQKWSRSKK